MFYVKNSAGEYASTGFVTRVEAEDDLAEARRMTRGAVDLEVVEEANAALTTRHYITDDVDGSPVVVVQVIDTEAASLESSVVSYIELPLAAARELAAALAATIAKHDADVA